MEEKVKNLVLALAMILIGIALIPVGLTALSGATWNYTIGGVVRDFSWVGYIVAFLIIIGLIGIGLSFFISSFKHK